MADMVEQFPNNQRCIERCGRVALCKQLIEKGEENLEQAKIAPGYSTSGPEYETDDGQLIPFDEFLYGQRQRLLQESGEALVSSGDNLMRMLLEACPDGAPIELRDGVTICKSERSGALSSLAEDMKYLED